MDKIIFKRYEGQFVKITIKPRDFTLYGTIEAVFDDCIEFRTDQKTSYLNFSNITSLVPWES